MSTIHVDIVSAEGQIYSGAAEMVILPAEQGDIGVTPQHTPVLTRLRPGEVRVQNAGQPEEHVFVSGGVLEIQPHLVTVLADTAIRADDIDEAQALEAKQRAEEALANRESDIEVGSAQAQLAAAVAQLKALENFRRKSGRGV